MLLLFLVVQFSIGIPSWHVYLVDAFSAVAILLLLGQHLVIKNSGCLVCFSVAYFVLVLLFGKSSSLSQTAGYLIGPFAYFLFGYSVVEKSKSDDEIAVFILLMIITSSALLWTRSVSDVQENGLINVSRAILNENDVEEASATSLGLVASLGIGGISYVLSGGTNKKLSILFLATFLLSVFSVLHIVNRSGLIISAMVALVSMIYSQRKSKSIVFVLIIAAIVYYILKINVDFYIDLTSAYQEREQIAGFSLADGGGRFRRWAKSIECLVVYPFGWDLDIMGYSHNVWFDVARRTGIIPFIFMVVSTVENYKTTTNLFRMKGNVINGMLVGMNVALFASAFVEPILEAVPVYFYIMCLIWGIQEAYFERIKQERHEYTLDNQS